MAMTTAKTIITKITIKNDENENKNWQWYKNIKTLIQNKKCLSKSN